VNRHLGALAGRLVGGVFAVTLALSGLAWGQTHLPEKRQGSVSLFYQHLDLGDELFSRALVVPAGDPRGTGNLGDKVDEGSAKIQAFVLAADYGLSSHLAVSGAATYVETSYEDNGPIPHGSYDDGRTHGTLQDASVTLLYKALDGPIAVVPFAGLVHPMRDYETAGFAAAGRGLNQTVVGVGLGWDAPTVPLNVEVSYDYRFVEKVEGINTNRSSIGLRVGYRFSSRLSGLLFASHRSSEGGYDLIGDCQQTNFLPVHDAASALLENSAGLGLSWAVLPAVDLYASYNSTLSGQNLQEISQLSVGAAWKFGGNPVLGD